jgi:hypothetical protein
MKYLRGLVALLLFIFVAACNRAPDTGTITKKDYDAGYYYFTYVCASYDKSGYCVVNVPIQNYEPEHFRVFVVNGDKKGWAEVSHGDYDRYEVGSCYPIGCEPQ